MTERDDALQVEAAEALKAVVEALRIEAGLSQVDFAYAVRNQGEAKFADSWLRSLYRGVRPYSTALLAALAKAANADPERIPHYRLSHFRDLFDERVVGLDQALANLEAISAATKRRLSAESEPRTKRPSKGSPDDRTPNRTRSNRGQRKPPA